MISFIIWARALLFIMISHSNLEKAGSSRSTMNTEIALRVKCTAQRKNLEMCTAHSTESVKGLLHSRQRWAPSSTTSTIMRYVYKSTEESTGRERCRKKETHVELSSTGHIVCGLERERSHTLSVVHSSLLWEENTVYSLSSMIIVSFPITLYSVTV